MQGIKAKENNISRLSKDCLINAAAAELRIYGNTDIIAADPAENVINKHFFKSPYLRRGDIDATF